MSIKSHAQTVARFAPMMPKDAEIAQQNTAGKILIIFANRKNTDMKRLLLGKAEGLLASRAMSPFTCQNTRGPDIGQVVDESFDAILENLRAKENTTESHLRVKDVTAMANSGIGYLREENHRRALSLRLLSYLNQREQKNYLPKVFPELKQLEAPKMKGK